MSSRRYPHPHKMITLAPWFDVIRFYTNEDIINPIYAKGNKFAGRIAHE